MSKGRREQKPGWSNPGCSAEGLSSAWLLSLAQAQLLQVLHSDLRAPQSRRCSAPLSGQALAPLPALPRSTSSVPAAGTGCNPSLPSPALLGSWEGAVLKADLRPCRSSVGRALHAVLPSSCSKPVLSHRDQGTGKPSPHLLGDVGSDFRGCTAADPHPKCSSFAKPPAFPRRRQ